MTNNFKTAFSRVGNVSNRSGFDVVDTKKNPSTEGHATYRLPVISGAFLVAALSGLGCSATISGTRGTEEQRDAAMEASVDAFVRDVVVRDSAPDTVRDAPADTSDAALADAGMCRFRTTTDGGVTDSGSRDGATSDSGRCVDSDGGRNASVRGTVISSGISRTDSCTGDGNSVMEYYCAPDGGIESVSISCTMGTVCREGACVPSPRDASYSFNGLIGDYVDRTSGDRAQHTTPDATSAYPFSTSETSDNANPFSDGMGGNIGSSQVYLHRVSGSMFAPFATSLVRDISYATYSESQNLWVNGDTHFDAAVNGVVNRVNFIAYSIKFNGPESEEVGIPVCTHQNLGYYAFCLDSPGTIDLYSDSSASHRVGLNFLGSQWLITRMTPPRVETTNPNQVVNGGEITLGKEARGGILGARYYTDMSGVTHEYPSYDVWDIPGEGHFYLDHQEVRDGVNYAVFRVEDDDCRIIGGFSIPEGNSLVRMNRDYRFIYHVWKEAPGYTFGANWADVSLLSDEISLRDGQELDQDSGRFHGYRVTLGWKNRMADDEVNHHVDTLRSVIVYSDAVADIASDGSNDLRPGQSVSFVSGLGGFNLQYQGLSSGSTLTPVTFELQNAPRSISATDGPVGPDGVRVGCTINAPYLQVSSALGGVFDVSSVGLGTSGEHGVSNQVLVALNGATCDGVTLAARSLFIRLSPSDSSYTGQFLTRADVSSGMNVLAPSSNTATIDFIPSPPHLAGRTCDTSTCADTYVAIWERATLTTAPQFDNILLFGVATRTPSDATFAFDSSSGTSPLTRMGQVLYGHAMPHPIDFSTSALTGPVTSGFEMVGEGYVTERGSTFDSLAATRVRVDLAGTLRQATFRVSELP